MKSVLSRYSAVAAGCLALGASMRTSLVMEAAADAQSQPGTNSAGLEGNPLAKLRLVQVVFRHGARTPLTNNSHLWRGHEWDVCGQAYEAVRISIQDINGGPPPPSPEDEKQMSKILEGGCAKGELTQLGQHQALQLGWWLRQRYIDALRFLPASYQPGVVASRTTNFSRTRATVQGVLTGLYPDTDTPIPVTTASELDEILYADSKRCPHLGVLIEASMAQLQAREASDREARDALRGALSDALDLPVDYWGSGRRWRMTDIHDALTSLAAHGKALPPGVTTEMQEHVNHLATEEFSTFISPSLRDEHGHAILQLSMGRVLDTLLGNMQQAQLAATQGQQAPPASGSCWPLLYLYSGHDSTIMPLLSALRFDVTQWPPYASNLVFELWELPPDTTASPRPHYVVRVLYNRRELPLPGAAQDGVASSDAPPASSYMDFEAFKGHVLGPFIMSEQDHQQACMAPLSHESPLPKPTSFAAPSNCD